MIKRGFFIGRFQPFHLGHMSVIEYALARDDELIIAIGSTDRSFTTKDPFTSHERFEMILAALAPFRDRVIVTVAPDINSNSMWVNYLEDLLPTFTHCYTSNPLVQVLFERAGYNVTSLKLVDSRASGTRVRQLMSEENDAWQTLVPSLVAEYIRENILEKRLI